MTYKSVVKSPAETDIKEALKWYSNISPLLARRFLSSIDHAMGSICKKPFLFQKRYGEIRIYFSCIFPYGIYFTIEENTIFIHAILHTKKESSKRNISGEVKNAPGRSFLEENRSLFISYS